jgi:hypothetical protein
MRNLRDMRDPCQHAREVSIVRTDTCFGQCLRILNRVGVCRNRLQNHLQTVGDQGHINDPGLRHPVLRWHGQGAGRGTTPFFIGFGLALFHRD